MSNWDIPLSDLDYGAEEEEAALRVLRSKWLSMGPEVEAFEREFAAFVGSPHAIALSNGTAALHLAYLALDIGEGDEVIQPAVNFVAAANMTRAVGATPVFADISDLAEPTIAPEEIERLITSRTKAVVVMHYGGNACRMDAIVEICSRHGIALVEDACHGVGGRCRVAGRERALGAIGSIGCFSFFSNKNLAIGEGGMVVTDSADLAARIRQLRSHGMTTLTWDRHRGHANTYDVTASGFNYRLDELRAALGRAQLSKLARNNELRLQHLVDYRHHLGSLADWIIPFEDADSSSAGHLMVLVAPSTADRERITAELRRARIQTSVHYPLIAEFSAFQRYADAEIPLSRSFASRCFTLPLYPMLTSDQVRHITSIVCREAASAVSAVS